MRRKLFSKLKLARFFFKGMMNVKVAFNEKKYLLNSLVISGHPKCFNRLNMKILKLVSSNDNFFNERIGSITI